MLWLPQAIKQLWLPGFFLALFITVQSGAFSGELPCCKSPAPNGLLTNACPCTGISASCSVKQCLADHWLPAGSKNGVPVRLSQLITDSTEKQPQASDGDRLLLSEADRLSQAPPSVRNSRGHLLYGAQSDCQPLYPEEHMLGTALPMQPVMSSMHDSALAIDASNVL